MPVTKIARSKGGSSTSENYMKCLRGLIVRSITELSNDKILPYKSISGGWETSCSERKNVFYEPL